MPNPIAQPNSDTLYVALSAFQKALDAIFDELVKSIAETLNRSARRDNSLSIYSERDLRNAVGDLTLGVFVDLSTLTAFLPGSTVGRAPYPKLLNSWLSWSALKVVESHADFIRDKVAPEVFAWLKTRGERVFQLVATYDQPHFWVDPRGYRLSDRIYRAGLRTRQKLDSVVADGIRTGRSARAISKDVEAMLLPGRQSVRTSKPYGTDASYDGMRLGRTEITRANVTMQQAAGLMNPFVEGMDFVLSFKHRDFDICDSLASVGITGGRLREPYPIATAPMPVIDTHPQCLCNVQTTVVRDAGAVSERLNASFEQGLTAPATPADEIPFLVALVGEYLADQVLDKLKDAYVSG